MGRRARTNPTLRIPGGAATAARPGPSIRILYGREADKSLDDFCDDRAFWASILETMALRILSEEGSVSADALNHRIRAYPYDKRAYGATLTNLHRQHLIQPRKYFRGRHGRPIIEYELWDGTRG